MRLAFRNRIFLGLVALGTVPLAIALVVLAVQVRSTGSATGPRAALDEVAASGRAMIEAIDTTALAPAERAAIARHTEVVADRTTLARRAEMLSRFAAGALGLAILTAAAILVAASVYLARRWARYYSAPIDELVTWVRHIEAGTSLPPDDGDRATPEFTALRHALREMADALDRARRQELERERLMAFREVARRVAHEIRSPLTSSRLALAQLDRTDPPPQQRQALDVLREETARLETMAKEFAEFGRLPEGPEAPLDLADLVDNVLQATVPDSVAVERALQSDLMVVGHYEPLRRAIQNLIRNAVEAGGNAGIAVRAVRSAGEITVSITDRGPGIPESLRHRIFEPYFTTKELGTGLGLAMVKQTVEAHRGTVAVHENPEGGATFTVTFADP